MALRDREPRQLAVAASDDNHRGRSNYLRFYAGADEVFLPVRFGELHISPETFPRHRVIVLGLRRLGYEQIKNLPADLTSLLTKIKGVGPRRTYNFLRDLARLANHWGGGPSVKLQKSTYWDGIMQQGAAVPLSPDAFPRSRCLLDQLKKRGIGRVGQIPANIPLNVFLQSLPSVGPKTAATFLATLKKHTKALAQAKAAASQRAPGPGRLKVLWGYGGFVPLHKSTLHVSFTTLLAGTKGEKAGRHLIAAGLACPDQLPLTLTELRERVPALTPGHLKNLYTALQNLTGGQAACPRRAFQRLNRLARRLARGEKPPKVTARNFRLFTLRIDGLTTGQRPTLQALGDSVGLTRERVRQLQPRIMQQLLRDHGSDLATISQALVYQGGFVDYETFTADQVLTDRRARLVLAELLQVRDITFNLEHQYLSTWPRKQVEALLHELGEFLDAALAGQPTDGEHVKTLISRFTRQRRMAPSVSRPLTSLALKKLLDSTPGGQWVRPMSQTALALHLFQEEAKKHPAGLPLYARLPALMEKCRQLSATGFPSQRALLGAILRNEDDVILWGWGVYVLREQIRAEPGDLAPIARWVEKQFEQGVPQLSARAAYDRFQGLLTELGVPNEHALYSCLRLFFGHRFYQPRSPKIFPVEQRENLTNAQLVTDYLQALGEQSYSALKEEFITVRGWQEFQLQQVLAGGGDIIRTGARKYGLLSDHQVPLQNLRALAKSFYNCFADDLVTVSVRRLFIVHSQACRRLGIKNEYVLYGLLNAFCDDLYLTRRFPHVTLHGATDRAQQVNKSYVDQYMRQAKRPVGRTALQEEFVQRRGWTERALDNALAAADVLRLSRGADARFVHAATINWTETKARRLALYMRSLLQELDESPFPFGHLQHLLAPGRRDFLPPLANGVPWTVELLRSLLAPLDFILLLGRKEYTFAANPNSAGVADYDDFIAWLLQKEFGGQASVHQLEERLRELDFRQASLRPTAGLGDLPYEITGALARARPD